MLSVVRRVDESRCSNQVHYKKISADSGVQIEPSEPTNPSFGLDQCNTQGGENCREQQQLLLVGV